METIKELVAAGRKRERTVIDAVDRATPYSYRDFCTNAWKAGNLLSHYGIRPGATLAIIAGPKEPTAESEVGYVDSAEPLLAVLAGATLGAAVDLTPQEPIDERAAVLPAAWVDRYAFEPGCSLVAYGGPPKEPSVTHFEGQSWSENPIEPPDSVSAADELLVSGEDRFTHETIMAATEAFVEECNLDLESRITLAAPITEPGALIAGVFAPLRVGGTIVLPGEDGTIPEDTDLVVGSEETDLGVASEGSASAVRPEETGTKNVSAASVTASLRERV